MAEVKKKPVFDARKDAMNEPTQKDDCERPPLLSMDSGMIPANADHVPFGFPGLSEYMAKMIVEPQLAQHALCELQDGDPGFLVCFSSGAALHVVFDLLPLLKHHKIYEQCLMSAYVGARINHARVPADIVSFLFGQANKNTLRQAGDPLPGPGPFVLYRGVSGHGRARRIRGFSWTDSLEKAQWFAWRFNLANPCVYTIEAPEDWVLAYIDDRQEREFIVELPDGVKLKRLR